MTLRGVLDVVLTDPGMARVVASAGSAVARRHRAAAGPAAGRRRARGAAAGRRRAGPGGHRGRAGRRPGGRPAPLLRPRPPGGDLPRLGDAAARAAQPPRRHRRPPAGRAARPDPPRRERHDRRAGRPGAQRAPAAVARPRRPRARSSSKPGDEADLEDVARALVDAAYTRVELVEKRGEFAVRGGLLDVFPPTEPHPVRVEFWGDEVDELRYFSAADQRSLDERPDRLWAPPCRELLLSPEVRARAAALAVEHPELVEVLGKLAEGIAVEGMESLIPALIGGRDAAAHRPRRPRHARPGLRPRAGAHAARPTWCARPRSSSPRPGRRPPRPGRRRSTSGRRPSATSPRCETAARMRGLPWWTTGAFTLHAEDDDEHVTLDATTVERFHGDVAQGDRAGARVAPRRLAGRRHLRRPRPGPARRRPVHRGRSRRPAGARHRSRPRRRPDPRHAGQPGVRVRLPRRGAGAAHRARPHRSARHEHAGRVEDAGPPAQRRRPGAAAARRPRRARAARRRPLHRDDQPHGQRRPARLPHRRVRAVAAEPAPDRLFVPTDALDQLTRYVGRRGAGAVQARRRRLEEHEEQGAQGGQADRRRADPPLLRAHGEQGSRVRPRHRLAARARGRLPVPGDPRPARRHRRGQGRHDAAGPDGPDHLRRRRLRQDRDRDPGGVQGGAGRQAGRRPRADDAAGQPALQDLLRAVRPVPGDRRRPLPVPVRRPRATRSSGSWPPARSTCSSAPTGCCSRPPGSRTSAWSSSTRSSASASSTRST